jgi:hypothetical protein
MGKSGLNRSTPSCVRISDRAWLALPASQKGMQKENHELDFHERGFFVPPTCPLEGSKKGSLVTNGESIWACSSYRLHILPDRPIFDLPSFQAEEPH